MTPDSAGTDELAPAMTSWASRRSSAAFSACRSSSGAALGQHRFLVGLRAELFQLIDRMAQPVAVALGTRHRSRCAAAASSTVRRVSQNAGNARGIGFEAAEGVEQPAVRSGIDQRAVVMLAVDLDQHFAQLLHHLHAHRLVIDEGARAAVGELHAAQDQIVLATMSLALRIARAG